MQSNATSERIQHLMNSMGGLLRYMETSSWESRRSDAEISDFITGNPEDFSGPQIGPALERWATSRDRSWYAYKMDEPDAQAELARSLQAWRGVTYDPADIFVTNGALAGITMAVNAIVDPGDEIIFISPPWYFYEGIISAAGGQPVKVAVDPKTFDLDLAAVEAAITPRTRGILINTPHNPTGRIFPAETLKALAQILQQAAVKAGRPIYLIADEAYSRIIYSPNTLVSPTAYYDHSFLVYTYSKTLLSPGERLGYVALCPRMPEGDRAQLRPAMQAAQILAGWAFASALMQHALVDLDGMCIDVGILQRRRDRLVGALSEQGYDVVEPEGTFYISIRSPWPSGWDFAKLLESYNVYALPGEVMDMPGYFRLSVTASDDMIERAIPAFATALDYARKNPPPAGDVNQG